MKYCKNCGNPIDDRAAICPKCGVKTGDEEVPKKKVNGLGIAGFVVSIVSLWLGVYFCIVSIVAVVLSSVAMVRKAKFNSCNGFATAGLVIGIISLAVWAIVWIAAASTLAALI